MEPRRRSKCGSSALQLGPCEADTRSQLKRILASEDFNVPMRVRQFLSYIVNQTLSGRADRIKGYSIAVEVFGRADDFDVLNDPVVRIEAGRLRRGLERYYLLAGKFDRLLIEIPKGAYVPRFHWRPDDERELEEQQPAMPQPRGAPAASGIAGWQGRHWLACCAAALTLGLLGAFPEGAGLSKLNTPSNPPAQSEGALLIVKPFVNLSDSPDADIYLAGLAEEVLAQLTSIRGLTIVKREPGGAHVHGGSGAMVPRQFGNRFILDATVRRIGGTFQVRSRLLDGETVAIIWSDTYDAGLPVGTIAEIDKSIASKVAGAIARADSRRIRAAPGGR